MDKLNFAINKNEAKELSEALNKKDIRNDYFINGNMAYFETQKNLSTLLEVYGSLMFEKGYNRGSQNA